MGDYLRFSMSMEPGRDVFWKFIGETPQNQAKEEAKQSFPWNSSAFPSSSSSFDPSHHVSVPLIPTFQAEEHKKGDANAPVPSNNQQERGSGQVQEKPAWIGTDRPSVLCNAIAEDLMQSSIGSKAISSDRTQLCDVHVTPEQLPEDFDPSRITNLGDPPEE